MVPDSAAEEVVAAVVVAGAAVALAAAVAGAANKSLSKLLSKPQPLNQELQGQKRHPLPRNSEEGAAVEADSAAEAADLAFRPASIQSRCRPAARTLPELYAFRRIREYKSQKLTERSGQMLL